MNQPRVLAHITLYNSSAIVLKTIESLHAQRDVNLTILVTDNGSSNDLPRRLQEVANDRLIIHVNNENLGFAAGQNQAARFCVNQNFDYLFMANPDARFESDALSRLIAAIADDAKYAGSTPLLFRADEALNPLPNNEIDAAGMMITPSLRHFDRQESGDSLLPVFGATGAAMLIKRDAIEQLALDVPQENFALYRVYPQLQPGASDRIPLFDEAFFAYREDADLAWRAQLLGLGFLFVPAAVGYHVRHVLPERRRTLSPLINRWSVRNRFLMQINNFSFSAQKNCIIPGIFWRNLIVMLGVLLVEWRSLAAFKDLIILFPRAYARRRALRSSSRYNAYRAAEWFKNV